MDMSKLDNLGEKELSELIKKAESIKVKLADEKKKEAMKQIKTIARAAGLNVSFTGKPKRKNTAKTGKKAVN